MMHRTQGKSQRLPSTRAQTRMHCAPPRDQHSRSIQWAMDPAMSASAFRWPTLARTIDMIARLPSGCVWPVSHSKCSCTFMESLGILFSDAEGRNSFETQCSYGSLRNRTLLETRFGGSAGWHRRSIWCVTSQIPQTVRMGTRRSKLGVVNLSGWLGPGFPRGAVVSEGLRDVDAKCCR